MTPSPYRRAPGARPFVVGHRGALALAPENTFAAFERAVAVGVDAIEFDVQRTADGVPIVMHDHTLDRTTNGHGAVRETPWSAVRALDAGSGERVPSLDELLAWARGRRVDLVLEAKQPAPGEGRARDDGLVPAIVAALRGAGLVDRTLIISFDHPAVAEALRLEPAARTALLVEGPRFVDPLAAARAVPGVMGLHVRWPWVSAELCAAAHEAGLHVHAWGFRGALDGALIGRLVDAGIDSLSADAPDALLALLASSR